MNAIYTQVVYGYCHEPFCCVCKTIILKLQVYTSRNPIGDMRNVYEFDPIGLHHYRKYIYRHGILEDSNTRIAMGSSPGPSYSIRLDVVSLWRQPNDEIEGMKFTASKSCRFSI